VDTNANGVAQLGDDSDMRLYTNTPSTSFLNVWGTNRIVLGQDDNGADANGSPYTITKVGADFNAGKVLCLELKGWIWNHQDPVNYTVTAKSYNAGVALPIVNGFKFEPMVSMYLDFGLSSINYGVLQPNITAKLARGDNDLSTADLPTVWDNGNINAQLAVSATAMVIGVDNDSNPATPLYFDKGLANPTVGNPNYQLPKIITNFDAHLDYKNIDGTVAQQGIALFNSQGYDDYLLNADGVTDLSKPITATGVPTLITTNGTEPVLLRECTPAQIDFSILNLANVPGTYQGSITLYIANYSGTVYPAYFSNILP
jgi:hypothetical protein